jgi:hypothetical protein
MLEHLTRDSLSAQLNTKFRLGVEAQKIVELELVEVEAHGDVAGQTGRFSALFRGPVDHFFPQGTYRMEHEQLGGMELFIVPIRKDNEGIYYEAVFNRVN